MLTQMRSRDPGTLGVALEDLFDALWYDSRKPFYYLSLALNHLQA